MQGSDLDPPDGPILHRRTVPTHLQIRLWELNPDPEVVRLSVPLRITPVCATVGITDFKQHDACLMISASQRVGSLPALSLVLFSLQMRALDWYGRPDL